MPRWCAVGSLVRPGDLVIADEIGAGSGSHATGWLRCTNWRGNRRTERRRPGAQFMAGATVEDLLARFGRI